MKSVKIDGDFGQPDIEIFNKIFNEHQAKRLKEIMVQMVTEPIDFFEPSIKDLYLFKSRTINDVADSYYYAMFTYVQEKVENNKELIRMLNAIKAEWDNYFGEAELPTDQKLNDRKFWHEYSEVRKEYFGIDKAELFDYMQAASVGIIFNDDKSVKLLYKDKVILLTLFEQLLLRSAIISKDYSIVRKIYEWQNKGGLTENGSAEKNKR